MTNRWELVPPGTTAIALCIFREYITLRISLPQEKKFIIISEGSQNVVYGSRYEITQDVPRGGQCEGKEYRLKGRHTGYDIRGEPIGFFDNEGFDNVVIGKIENQRLIPPTIEIGSNEFEWVEWEMTWTDTNGDRIGFGTENPITLRVNVEYTRFGLPITVTPLSWGRGIIDAGVPIYTTESITFTYWERVDGTSLEDDLEECPDEVTFTITVFDCEDNVLFTRSYKDTPPTVIEEEGTGFGEPEYLEIPLNFIMGVNVLHLTDQTVEPWVYIVRLSLFAPFVPPEDLPGFDPFPPGSGRNIDFRDIVSPPCTERWAKIEYICGRCESCPSGTVCRIQQDNEICCYDGAGNLLGTAEVGCETPDFIC